MKGASRFPNVSTLDEFRKLLGAREKELAKPPEPTKYLASVYSVRPGLPGLLGNALLRNRPSDAGPSIDALTADLRRHVAYLWLSRSASYQSALRAFRERRQIESGRAHAALSEVRFIGEIVTWLEISVNAAAKGWKPISISNKQRERTVGHIEKLLDDIDGGVTFNNYSEAAQLKYLLSAFRTELCKPRKHDYAGDHALDRLMLKGLAFSLLGHHGLTTADVVAIGNDVACLYGFNVSSRWVQRRVYDAAREHAEVIEAALGREDAQQLARIRRGRTRRKGTTRK